MKDSTTPDHRLNVPVWRTSTRSGGGSGQNCVEVGASASTTPAIAIRDTKNRPGGALAITAGEWAGWTSAIKTGSFDS